MQPHKRSPIPRRATAEQLPTHRAGHSSNIHPEDEPYWTAQKKRYPDNPLDLADGLDYPEEPKERQVALYATMTHGATRSFGRETGNLLFMTNHRPGYAGDRTG